MDRRPLSLTIIAWFLIVTTLFGLYSAMTMGSNEAARQLIEDAGLSLQFQQAQAVVGAVIVFACAYGILKGLPWSRVVYVGWSIVSLAIGFLTSPFTTILVLGVVFLAVIAFFLFRPVADDWFAARGLELRRNDAGRAP